MLAGREVVANMKKLLKARAGRLESHRGWIACSTAAPSLDCIFISARRESQNCPVLNIVRR